jgi:hypothetical protein
MRTTLRNGRLDDCSTGNRNSKRRNTKSRIRTRLALFERLENRSLLAGFQFADFSDSSGLQLVLSATINSDHELRLTPVSPTIPGVPIHAMTGGAWYVQEKSPVAAGFSTTFAFRATNTDDTRIDWGFAFLIQNTVQKIATPTKFVTAAAAWATQAQRQTAFPTALPSNSTTPTTSI